MGNRRLTGLFMKFLLLFSLVILAASLVLFFSLRKITGESYRTLVLQTDRELARRIAPPLEDYYRQNRSWEGVAEFFLPGMVPGPMMQDGRPMPMMMRDGRRMPMMLPGQFLNTRLLLLDPEGKAIFDTNPPGEENRQELPRPKTEGEELGGDRGVQLDSRGPSVGTLLVGSMINPELTRAGSEFIYRLNRAFLINLLLLFSGALIVLALGVRRITRPIRELKLATGKLASGDFSVRVPRQTEDEIGELTDRFNAMATSLQEAEAFKRRMIADTAHELRTPLTLIRGKLEMILEGIYPGDASQLKAIYRETEILHTLVNDLHQLAESEGGAMQLEVQTFSATGLLEDLLALYEAEAANRGIALSVRSSETASEIQADRRRISQVLANLVSNALRHTPEGGRIRIQAEERGSPRGGREALFSVKNSGSSLPPGTEEKIFQRFYRVDNDRNRKSGGRGLGLSISRAIIEAHGGRIWAENSRNQTGVVVWFSLPLAEHTAE